MAKVVVTKDMRDAAKALVALHADNLVAAPCDCGFRAVRGPACIRCPNCNKRSPHTGQPEMRIALWNIGARGKSFRWAP